jgi:hypothetical protein
MPFLWKSTSRVPDQKYQLCGETSLLAASALCPVGLAHVSRLIGKFDTTENRSGWQVGFAETFQSVLFKLVQTHQTPLAKEWRFYALHRSLASRID